MELTREQIKAFEKCGESRTCEKCPAKMHCSEIGQFEATSIMAKQLLAELDAPKVWDGAPEWATKAVVNWSAPTHYSGVYKEYTRILHKTRARQIAEDSAIKLDQLEARIDTHLCNFNKDDFASIIEQAILKYAEENK